MPKYNCPYRRWEEVGALRLSQGTVRLEFARNTKRAEILFLTCARQDSGCLLLEEALDMADENQMFFRPMDQP